ncbi:MAG: hypothetical protein COB97_07480 [Paracoccus sp.]|nr:MAG: hypothetical protein COB97_07480 [Paracoccus sp. (in: a-proteobacteria)]
MAGGVGLGASAVGMGLAAQSVGQDFTIDLAASLKVVGEDATQADNQAPESSDQPGTDTLAAQDTGPAAMDIAGSANPDLDVLPQDSAEAPNIATPAFAPPLSGREHQGAGDQQITTARNTVPDQNDASSPFRSAAADEAASPEFVQTIEGISEIDRTPPSQPEDIKTRNENIGNVAPENGDGSDVETATDGTTGVVEAVLDPVLGPVGDLTDDLLGQDGLVGGVLDPVLGDGGLVDSVLDPVLGSVGDLTDGLLGQDGLVGGVLDPVLGEDGVVEAVLDPVLGPVGDLTDDLLGQGGLVGGVLDPVLGEDGVVEAVLDPVLGSVGGVTDGLLGQGGLLGGIFNPAPAQDGPTNQASSPILGENRPSNDVTDPLVEDEGASITRTAPTGQALLEPALGDNGILPGLIGSAGETVEAATDSLSGERGLPGAQTGGQPGEGRSSDEMPRSRVSNAAKGDDGDQEGLTGAADADPVDQISATTSDDPTEALPSDDDGFLSGLLADRPFAATGQGGSSTDLDQSFSRIFEDLLSDDAPGASGTDRLAAAEDPVEDLLDGLGLTGALTGVVAEDASAGAADFDAEIDDLLNEIIDSGDRANAGITVSFDELLDLVDENPVGGDLFAEETDVDRALTTMFGGDAADAEAAGSLMIDVADTPDVAAADDEPK